MVLLIHWHHRRTQRVFGLNPTSKATPVTNDASYPSPTTTPIPVLLGAPTDAINHCTHIPSEGLNFYILFFIFTGHTPPSCLSYPGDGFLFLRYPSLLHCAFSTYGLLSTFRKCRCVL